MPPMEISRRTALGGALAAPLALALPHKAEASRSAGEALAAALAKTGMPVADSKLTLLRFEAAEDGGTWYMTAVVEMTWPPGLRRRRFTVSRGTGQDALNALYAEIVTSFRVMQTG